MRIAFDVKGTIEGPKKALVLKLFKGLQAKGHECVVWSNSISYAADAVKDNNLEADFMWKKSKIDLKESGSSPFDMAVEDDRSQWWLGAEKFLFVDELNDELVDQILSNS